MFRTLRSNSRPPGIRAILVAIMMLLACAEPLWAQNAITGRITSGEDGSPVPGASVIIKGTTIGTITDSDGNYRLETPTSNETVLVFSFVGYTTQEVSVSGRSSIDVTMATDATQLSEVVVTALGIEKDKSKIGYATQEVKGNDLIRAREPNGVNSLVGKVAGLNIGASSEILGAPAISLRGRRPIFVIDGMPVQSDTWNISPDDIESYTVLKGPAASALYGTQGRDGAIIITTKRGTKDKRNFSIDFNSSTMTEQGFLAIPKVQDEYGPGDHGRYAFGDGKGGGLYDSDYDVWGPKFEGQLIPQYDGEVVPGESFTTTFPSGATFTGNIRPTPWTARGKDNLQKFLRPGLLSTNNISVSANGDKYDMRVSYTHTGQRGQVPNTNLSADNINISTGYDFSEKIRFESNINYNKQYTDNVPDVNYGPNSMIYNVIIWGGADWSMDDMKNYWQKGKEGLQQIYADYTRYNNPWFITEEWLRGHYKTDVYGYLKLNYKPTSWLDLHVRSSINSYDLLRTEKFPISATVYGREQALGDYREDQRNLFENNTDFLGTVNKDLSDAFNINGSVGFNQRTFLYRSTFTTTDYLNVPASSLTPGAYNFENTRNPIKAYNFEGSMVVRSAYYTFDFNYKEWLNLATTGRWEWDSTIPETQRPYFYPSASLSVVLSKALTLPGVISFAKLKAAYANVGSGNTATSIGPTPSASYPLGYGSAYSSPYGGPNYQNSAVYSTPLVSQGQPGAYYPNTLVNKNLDAYFSSAREFGFDIRFLENKIGVDFTYFQNIDGPKISTQPLATATGYSGAIKNGETTKRSGIEIVLTAAPVATENFRWNILFNYGKFKEVLEKLPAGTTGDRLGFIKVGDRVDRYYAQGFYKTPDGELINDASGRPIPSPVAQYMGNINPDWAWGITNKLNYKNFGLSFQFDGRVGGMIINYIQRQTFRGGRHIETVQGEMGIARDQDYHGVKSWVGPGMVVSNGATIQYDPVTGAITNYDELTFTPNTTATFLQDWISRYYAAEEANVMSRSFAKLREVTVSYNIPSQVLTKTFIRNANISLVGRNLLYFAEKKDMDIDQFVSGDYSSLQSPTQRRYGVNINLTF